ncbi:shikimate dehydrogenase [Nocardioides sp. Kera G14]|uniref:shikimate dehydrogenase n=1 Tax=Nocardioides sp. Kera G14 TaxID=2884264 RepID=UPI001D124452|nr:shikimate dehydrogenase [Nocardioides sp. Kera G14]UDY22164.1 shikimate dehydrogenase [Nocardioides sp. Kera G14]
MPRCAVIGDPVEHSLSPVIHQAAYDAVGLSDWSYSAIRVDAGAVGEFLSSLAGDVVGLSVTAPHKREALARAATVTDRASLAGGANTLVRRGEGWAADNTDLPGAVAAIGERFDGALHHAVILGGGATAASVGLALAELGVTAIEVAVREAARAAETVTAIAAHPSAPEVRAVDLLDHRSEPDIVVATIPVAAQLPALVEEWSDAPVLFEVTYNEWPTPLVAAAAGVVVSGLDLLVHQAALQFELFTGQAAPLDAMRGAGEDALARRSRR